MLFPLSLSLLGIFFFCFPFPILSLIPFIILKQVKGLLPHFLMESYPLSQKSPESRPSFHTAAVTDQK